MSQHALRSEFYKLILSGFFLFSWQAVSGAMDKRKVHGSKPYEKPASDRTET